MLSFKVPLILLITIALSSSSSIFNCPAPRSPDNGLSFIFQDGEVVRFRCHPGFLLTGQAESKCINNVWNSPVPECRADSDDSFDTPSTSEPVPTPENVNRSESNTRSLFTWNEESSLYGVGPRRLPLINGLWKHSDNRVLSIGHSQQNQTPDKTNTKLIIQTVPKSSGKKLVKQELGIAEIRHRQQQEVRKSRPIELSKKKQTELAWRQRQISQARHSPSIFYAGSRSASAYRGDKLESPIEETQTKTISTRTPPKTQAVPAPPPTESTRPAYVAVLPTPSLRINDHDLTELRRRHIEQTLQTKMRSGRPLGQHSSEKAGLVEEARRKQYEYAQSLLSNRIPQHIQRNRGPSVIPRRAVRPNRQKIDNRHLFSKEKAGLVDDGSVRQFLTPAGMLYSLTTPTTITFGNQLQPITSSYPVLMPPTPILPRRTQMGYTRPTITAGTDKAGETQHTSYQQYLQAEHLRRILEHETASLMTENGRSSDISNDPNTQNILEQLYRVAELYNLDLEFISRLSPALQINYIQEVLASRVKQDRESHLADDFLKRYYESDRRSTETFPSVSSRASGSEQVTIIQSQPAVNGTKGEAKDWLYFDLSCNKYQNGQRLFIRAPKIKNAFVHRYERRRNPSYPNNSFHTAEFRCRRGYRLLNSSSNTLFCRKMEWVGILPRCLAGSG